MVPRNVNIIPGTILLSRRSLAGGVRAEEGPCVGPICPRQSGGKGKTQQKDVRPVGVRLSTITGDHS